MDTDTLRGAIRSFLKFEEPTQKVQFDTREVVSEGDYDRTLVRYQNDEGQEIPAFRPSTRHPSQ